MSGLGGGWLSLVGQSKHHKQQRISEREQWRDEMRRDAYHTYIAAAKRLSAAWWKTYDSLKDPDGTPTEWRERFAEAHGAWVEFSTAAAADTVAGPRVVADAADSFRRVMSDWEATGMVWTQEAGGGDPDRLAELKTRFETLAEAKRVPERAFQELARKALGTDD